jgi:hypothetical protein
MSEGYPLSATLHRPDLIEWLETLPDERRDQQVEQALFLGFQVLTFVQAGASEESMNRFFKPVLSSMDDLSDKLNTMMTYSQKSQRLGELGEAMVASQLQDAFPRDHFEIQSSTGHQADVHAVFDLGDGIEEPALIEVKLYTNDVPSKELDKFRKDLREQRRRYGLMVSLTSRLTGISGPFGVEASDDYVAVYIPNAGTDGLLLYWGASLIKALMTFERQSGMTIQVDAIEAAFQRLQTDLGELREASKQVGQFRETIRRTQTKLNGALDELVDQAISAEIRLKHVVERLEGRLLEELHDLPRTSGETALPEPSPVDEIEAFLVALEEAKDKRAPAYRALYSSLEGTDALIALEGENWKILRGDAVVAETTSTKTRVDTGWLLGDKKQVHLDIELETFKKDRILISGKDISKMADRLRERLDS